MSVALRPHKRDGLSGTEKGGGGERVSDSTVRSDPERPWVITSVLLNLLYVWQISDHESAKEQFALPGGSEASRFKRNLADSFFLLLF